MRLATLIALLFLTAVASAEDLPSYSEAVAAYSRNIGEAFPLSVEWTITIRELPSKIELDSLQYETYKKAVDDPDNEQSKPTLLQMIAGLELGLTESARKFRVEPHCTRHFLWTDGKRLHYRVNNDPAVSMDKDFGESLDQATNCRIYSYDPDREPKLRVWLGYGLDGKTFTGFVANQDVSEFLNRAHLPPLGRIREEWRRSQYYSDLDKWTDDAEGLRGSEAGGIIAGDDTVLIRNILGNDSDKNAGVRRLTAWCAHRKGFIPKKVILQTTEGPSTVELPKERAVRTQETIEVEGIHEVAGLFYPKKITSTEYETDPEWLRSKWSGSEVPEFMPTVPVSVSVEEVISVKPHREIPETWLSLPFPLGTHCMDLDTRAMNVAGVSKADSDRQLVQELFRDLFHSQCGQPNLPHQ